MKRRIIAFSVLFIFLTVSIFGLTSLLSHAGHHTKCPLQGAPAVLCESTTIEHIGIWQAMFVATLFLLVFALGTILFSRCMYARVRAERIRVRSTHTRILRPTLLQELYSSGILNRKEPYAFFRVVLNGLIIHYGNKQFKNNYWSTSCP
jgi:hypothetical protein